MSAFTITKMALADLKEISRYTQEQWGRKQRTTYLTMLDACFNQLAKNPLKGKDCSEIRTSYRKYAAGSHVIFYRQLSDHSIEIVRILHGRMDIEARLSESGINSSNQK
jgi:toxin ParE1/3/4